MSHDPNQPQESSQPVPQPQTSPQGYYPQQPPQGYTGYPPPPPQGQWQGQGYYPGPGMPQQLPKKKGLPLPVSIGLIVLAAIIAIAVIASIGGSAGKKDNNAQVVATATSAPVNTAPVSTTSAAVVAANTTKAAVAPTATSAPAKVEGKVGDTIQAGNYLVTVNNVDIKNSFQEYFKPKAGNVYVAVDVTIESKADKGVSVNPFYAKLVDSQGYSYNFTVAGKDPALSSQNDMAAGEKMRGWITFEVPANAKGLKFIYSPLSITEKINITFNIS